MRASYYQLLAGLHDSSENSKAHYGTCAHLAWQKWAMGYSIEECIQLAVDKMLTVDVGGDWRGPSHLSAMLTKWFKENEERPEAMPSFGLKTSAPAKRIDESTPLVEWQWEFPIYSDSFAVVMLQGTIDLVYLVDGKVRVRDYKTTADREVESKLEELLTSTQFLTYALAVKELLGIEDASYEICGVFLRKDGKNIFQSSRVMDFNSEEGRRKLDRHKDNLRWFAASLVWQLEGAVNGEDLPPEDYRFCTSGWGCPYRGITNANSAGDKQFIADNSFEKKTFNAHHHRE
jgi:hypothetical protein